MKNSILAELMKPPQMRVLEKLRTAAVEEQEVSAVATGTQEGTVHVRTPNTLSGVEVSISLATAYPGGIVAGLDSRNWSKSLQISDFANLIYVQPHAVLWVVVNLDGSEICYDASGGAGTNWLPRGQFVTPPGSGSSAILVPRRRMGNARIGFWSPTPLAVPYVATTVLTLVNLHEGLGA